MVFGFLILKSEGPDNHMGNIIRITRSGVIATDYNKVRYDNEKRELEIEVINYNGGSKENDKREMENTIAVRDNIILSVGEFFNRDELFLREVILDWKIKIRGSGYLTIESLSDKAPEIEVEGDLSLSILDSKPIHIKIKKGVNLFIGFLRDAVGPLEIDEEWNWISEGKILSETEWEIKGIIE